MGLTANLKLPYPEPADSVDVPRDIKALAETTDTYTTDAVTVRYATGANSSLPGAETDIITLALTPGNWAILATLTADWSTTGSPRYTVNLRGTNSAVIATTAIYTGGTNGTVPVAFQVIRYPIAVAGNVRLTAYQTGVTGGNALVSYGILTARKLA